MPALSVLGQSQHRELQHKTQFTLYHMEARALTPVEQRYSQTEREALTIVWSCEHFHLYQYGAAFTMMHTSCLTIQYLTLQCICPNLQKPQKSMHSMQEYASNAIPKAMTLPQIQKATKHDHTLQHILHILSTVHCNDLYNLPYNYVIDTMFATSLQSYQKAT